MTPDEQPTHDVPPVTEAGLPERRKVRYVTWDELRRVLRLGGVIALLVVVSSSVGIYWAWSNGRKLERNGADAVLRSCLSRSDLRVTVAVAIDQLRILALREPKTQAEKDAVDDFLARTQAPVDRLLSQAAGVTVRVDPPGSMPQAVRDRVQALALSRCQKQADDFRVGIGPD